MEMAPVLSWQLAGARLRAWFAGLQRKRPVRQLRLRETLSLGEKRQLVIVECGGRRLLVGVSGNYMALLAELEASAERGNGSE